MTTTQLTSAPAVIVGVAMMDADEARQVVKNINRRLDAARCELLELYDREGWRALGYNSWGACVNAEFEESSTALYRQLAVAKIERELFGDSRIGNPIPASQLEAAAKAAPDQRIAVFKRADEIRGDSPRTAKHVTQAVAEMDAPDLPIEYAVIQRRYEQHDHVLSAAWDGVTRRYVVRKEGGTGVVMLWPDVLSKLERLDDQAEYDSDHPDQVAARASAPAGWVCDQCGTRITDMRKPLNPICSTCIIQRQADQRLRGASATVAVYNAQERADQDILTEAIGVLASARGLLSQVKVAQRACAVLDREVAVEQARAFWLYQSERLTRFSPTAMISLVSWRQALDHIAVLMAAEVSE